MAAVAIVIVAHEARARAITSVDTVAPAPGDVEVVVVDNGSTDGTAEAMRHAHPYVRVLVNDSSRGFAAAANQAIAATTAPFVCLMPAGTLIAPRALIALLGAFDSHERVAAAAPLVRSPDGSVQRHGLFSPTAYTALVVLLGLARLPIFRREAERYYGPHIPGAPIEVENLSGACMMLSRAAIEDVGGFDDERFFIYCEDVDWCLRARARGWRLLFVPAAEAVREKSASSKGDSRWVIRQYYRSLRNFYEKHHAQRHPLPVRALWRAGAHLKESVALLADALRRTKGVRY